MMNGSNDLESSYPAAPPPAEEMYAGSSRSGLSVDDERPGLENGHSLPNVDELKTDAKAKNSERVGEDGQVIGRRTGGWVFWVALLLALVVIGAIIGIAVAATSGGGSPSTASSTSSFQTSAPQVVQQPSGSEKETGTDVAPAPVTAAPAPAPSGGRASQIKAYLTKEGISSDADLSTEGSPQFRAVDFLAVRDAYAIDIPTGNKDTPEGYAFMTRYVLSTLFFSTRGNDWTFDLNFLSDKDVCSWYSVLQYVDLSTEYRGVACVEDGTQVESLFMSKLCCFPFYDAMSSYFLLTTC